MKLFKWISLAVLILIMILTMAACLRPRARVGENIAENIIEKNLEKEGVDADVDISGDEFTVTTEDGELTYQTGETWPDDAPSIIPEFKDGELEGQLTMDKNVVLTFIVSGEDAATKYINTLESAGFKQSVKSEADGSLFYTAEKSGYQVVVTYQDETMSIMWNEME